ncbi:DDE-type integrase/transposase/recombinase [Streptomyces sp. CA-251387]|uniref:DDE-type integrase/transposase/recombinase n=1 Tax=Streptomyces sp. CA-251387 TaxID=3240064 RepID=UPI003D8EC8DE
MVNRDFTRHPRDQLWVTAITEHFTLEGKVYCEVVPDTFSRRLVGWSIDASPTAALATNTLSMAIGNRHRQPGGTIIHSRVQFGSWAFTERARVSRLVPSMARSESAWTTR